MPSRRRRRTTFVPDPSGCEHFWMIESPNGPTSKGSCRVCGETRDFVNYLESSAWTSSGMTIQQLSEAELGGGSAGRPAASG